MRTSGDHPNYSIIEIRQNTEKNPGDLGRLILTQIIMIIPTHSTTCSVNCGFS